MAQKQKQSEEKEQKQEKLQKEVRLIRILSTDIAGDRDLYSGLTLIKGVSWSFANGVCKKLGIGKKKIQDLTKEEIGQIEEFIKKPELPGHLLNRRKDIIGGVDRHLQGSDLDLQKEFDIKKLKKIKSYKGVRHILGLPVRGQRTRSNFRRNRKKGGAVGVKKKGAKRQ